MSDNFGEWLEDNQGKVNFFAQYGAVNQRSRIIDQQRESTAALKKQAAALQEQNRIEKDRAKIEQQRLAIELQRVELENADRKLQNDQAEHLKNLRNLMAELSMNLSRIRKKLPS